MANDKQDDNWSQQVISDNIGNYPPVHTGSPFAIVPTEGKGLGVFATRDLDTGDEILVEKGSLWCSDTQYLEDRASQLIQNFGTLDEQVQIEYLKLHSAPNPTEVQALHEYFKTSILPGDDPHSQETLRKYILVCRIYNANSFEIEPSKRDESGHKVPAQSAVFIEASRFNHSCDPNLWYHCDTTRGYFRATASRPIETGEELTINYIPVLPVRADRLRDLKMRWGFDCRCNVCDGYSIKFDRYIAQAEKSQNRLAQTERKNPEPKDTSLHNVTLFERRVMTLKKLHWAPELFFAEEKCVRLYIECYKHFLAKGKNLDAIHFLWCADEMAEEAIDLGNKWLGIAHYTVCSLKSQSRRIKIFLQNVEVLTDEEWDELGKRWQEEERIAMCTVDEGWNDKEVNDTEDENEDEDMFLS